MGCLKLTYEPVLKVITRTEQNTLSREGKSCAGMYKYKYNGKEWQDELGLNIYDFGFRNYDPAVGKRYESNPYNYVQNSPMFRFDPDGLTDFTLNKKTGEVKQIGDETKGPDRILKSKNGEVKYDRKGVAKVAIKGIEKGILQNGQNFKNKDEVISVGGEGQPSVKGVKSFVLKLSEYLDKEIKGFSYSSDGSGNITDMVLGKYINNRATKSYGSVVELQKKYGENFSFNNVYEQFHTHPNGELGATKFAPELSQDVKALQNDKPFVPNAIFIVLYRKTGQEEPEEYNYTHNYKPKKN